MKGYSGEKKRVMESFLYLKIKTEDIVELKI